MCIGYNISEDIDEAELEMNVEQVRYQDNRNCVNVNSGEARAARRYSTDTLDNYSFVTHNNNIE